MLHQGDQLANLHVLPVILSLLKTELQFWFATQKAEEISGFSLFFPLPQNQIINFLLFLECGNPT